jgi:FAD:protein FMN transferase
MKETRILMGMPVTVHISDKKATARDIDRVFDYFIYVDNKFSTYKEESEISRINNHQLKADRYSNDMKIVLKLCEQTKLETDGYFNIIRNGRLDPSGLVKGWAIFNAANLIEKWGFENFFVDAGGDIQTHGKNENGQPWKIGIRNPFDRRQVVKVIRVDHQGVATSGTYIRGQHIYNPFKPDQQITEIVSLTVIGPNIYEADRFATAAFAMGKEGIDFVGKLNGFEGYMIDNSGTATFTDGFNNFVTS